MNQNLLAPGSFYLRGAIAPNIGGPLIFEGFSGGLPIFGVNAAGAQTATTSASNILPDTSNGGSYINEFTGDGTVEYTLPSPDSTLKITISNGMANPLRVQAAAGSSIRWFDGTLHPAILSGGNGVDNIVLIGVDNRTWLVVYVGEVPTSTWTPQT